MPGWGVPILLIAYFNIELQACNRSREIRDFLDLQDNREVYASITIGYPKYPFKKTIPREFAEVRYLQ
jgi:hypothetical protein